MNRTALNIRNRLSLRLPQEESLQILCDVAEKLTMKKNADLAVELEKVKALYPTCADFERNFPSMCFALATGVGKTRLMGAFVSYLYIEKGIKNFFVLAPNLTIYNKLIEDFSNVSSPKYVFQGIGEFVHSQPVIITGENYEFASQRQLFDSEVHINIFNISKINSETRAGKEPKIKRLAEYLGESYFHYLSNLEDLVLLMDESHHYRADRGMEVINELKPILGLELTATPQVEKGGSAIKFKNVVFEYSLAKAIRDGYVKDPAVATRRDFDPSRYTPEDLDRIKLEDGMNIHEDTKVGLDIYARNNKVRQVKPFVLVVAKDTEHAGKLKQLITSQSFFNGKYADKVMEIHSSQSGEEKDENIDLLLSLEKPDNRIEIVIHVNMLKEGWDVTNLYTIIPLRTAASTTLREQTIGRGLRLPYGKKTGNDKVDKLTIVAHDKFQEIIDEANKPDSIIRKENIIVINPEDLSQPKEVVTSISVTSQKLIEQRRSIETNTELKPEQKQAALQEIEAKEALHTVFSNLGKSVGSVKDLSSPEIKKIAVEKLRESFSARPQGELFAGEMVAEVEKQYESMAKEFTENIIEIPRITIQPSGEVKTGFNDFDLETKNLNYQPVSEEILIKKLREQENGVVTIRGNGRITVDSYENLIVNELINNPEIDYDSHSELLFKLAGQAVAKFRSYLSKDDELSNVIQYNKHEIGRFIFAQMMEHFYCHVGSYEKPIVYPFTEIKEHNYEKFSKDAIHDYHETITPTNSIPSKVFTGFIKAYHTFYKFDSKTEKDFSAILEQDRDVLKWLRPAHGQFAIYWDHNSKAYHPDFVVEADKRIYLIETKKEGDIATEDVQEKARAALVYCKNAAEYAASKGSKPWSYILIPHSAVLTNMSFETLTKKYLYRGIGDIL